MVPDLNPLGHKMDVNPDAFVEIFKKYFIDNGSFKDFRDSLVQKPSSILYTISNLNECSVENHNSIIHELCHIFYYNKYGMQAKIVKDNQGRYASTPNDKDLMKFLNKYANRKKELAQYFKEIYYGPSQICGSSGMGTSDKEIVKVLNDYLDSN